MAVCQERIQKKAPYMIQILIHDPAPCVFSGFGKERAVLTEKGRIFRAAVADTAENQPYAFAEIFRNIAVFGRMKNLLPDLLDGGACQICFGRKVTIDTADGYAAFSGYIPYIQRIQSLLGSQFETSLYDFVL